MTVSDGRRRGEQKEALITLVRDARDHSVNLVTYSPSEPEYDQWLNTTWLELQSLGYLHNRASGFGKEGTRYQLTPYGWLTGLEWAGELKSEAVRSRCIELVRILKAVVKGRDSSYDGFIDVRDASRDTGVPEGWIHNAVASGLLQLLFPKNQMNASMEDAIAIRVPPTFGMNHL